MDEAIDAAGIMLVDVAHLCAKHDVPMKPEPFALYAETEFGIVRFYMSRAQVEKFARDALVLISNN